MGLVQIGNEKIMYKPYHDEISIERIKERLLLNRTFKRIFQKNLTNPFMDSMKSVVNPTIHHAENTIWNVMGFSGSGKSRATISLAKKITPETFSYKNVVFYDQQIIEMAGKVKRDSFLIRDETVDTFGVGSHRIASDMQTLSETARKYGLNLAFLSPSEKHIDVAKWNLYTVDIDYENEITRVALQDPFTKSFLGSVYVKVLPETDPDWVKYEQNKDAFIESIRDGKISGKTNYMELAKDVLRKIELDIYEKKKERLAFIRTQYPNFTNAEIETISTFVEIGIKKGVENFIDYSDKEQVNRG